ncbi:MAG TPA: DNA helicase, partial [Thermomicrobiales bacterium]|nr:DNA helicase [Thermomicrobiales bacterium]
MDRFGHVVVPYSPWFTFRETLDIATGELLPVRSAFAIRYNTVLNLWDPPHGERVRAMLQQSLAQFQSAQRIRDLEDDIIAVGKEIDGIPQGCLIGLDAGDELLEEYRRLNRTLTAAQSKERRLEQDQTTALRALDAATPWNEPGRQALRRAFRTAKPGLLAHARDLGWGIFLGRGGQGGVGRFLFGHEIGLLPEYRRLDHLAEAMVDLPPALIEPPDTVVDARQLVSPAELDALWARIDALGLPNLEALTEEHRQREQERAAPELLALDAAIAQAKAQVAEVETARQTHPCHTCPRRKEHRDYLADIDKLDKDRRGIEEVLGREIDAEDERIRGVIRGIRNVLHRFGYLHRSYPTPKADMLAEIFDNDGL